MTVFGQSGGIPASPPEKWIHFRWRLSGNRSPGVHFTRSRKMYSHRGTVELRFVDPRKFGLVWYGSPSSLVRDSYLGRLGQEPQAMTSREFSRILESARGMVKPFLLRQDRIAGIGNIIADEALWRARIHPETQIVNLDTRACRRLYQGIRHTIRAMLASGGTSIRNWKSPDGSAGRYQERRMIYGKAGSPCPRCGTRLLRIVVGGRGTTICPSCQQE